MNKINAKQAIIISTIFVLSMTSIIAIMMDSSRPDYYGLLPLLPITFIIVNIIFIDLYKSIPSNIGLTIIVLLYFFRMVFLPLFMVLGDYESLLKFNLAANTDKAIYLMIYELIVIYFVSYITFNKNKDTVSKKKYKGKKPIKLKLFGEILFILSVFCILVWILIPESHSIYKTILQAGDPDFTWGFYDHRAENVNSLERITLTLFTLIMDIIIIFVPAYILIAIKRKFSTNLGIILSMPLVLSPMLLVSATIAHSILYVFLLLLFIGKLYPKFKNKLYFISVLSASIFVIFYFFLRFNTGESRYGQENIFQYLSSILTAYFTGLDNVAATFNVSEPFKLDSLFYNLYGAIPFNNTFFGLEGTNLQSLFNLANSSYGQIPSTIGSGYYYFGFIFAPLISVVLVFISVKYGNLAINQYNLWKYVTYSFFSILMAMGLVMYNETIVLRWFTNLILPLLILSNFSSDEDFIWYKDLEENSSSFKKENK